jgi:hypothetical protein
VLVLPLVIDPGSATLPITSTSRSTRRRRRRRRRRR